MSVPDAPPPYDAVVLDCDSTLCALEGIDELARLAGVDVSGLTARAMDGSLPLEEVYRARLDLVRPDRAALDALGERYVATLLPHARELVAALRELGKRVCVVSGGLLPPVVAAARAAGIAAEDVFAVPCSSAPDGAWAGFDEASPLARSGGKPLVLARLAAGARVALVGDGVTDLEAAPACARFVAFGGVERRPAVWDAARARVDAPDLAALLPWLVAPDERERLAAGGRHAALLSAAERHPAAPEPTQP